MAFVPPVGSSRQSTIGCSNWLQQLAAQIGSSQQSTITSRQSAAAISCTNRQQSAVTIGSSNRQQQSAAEIGSRQSAISDRQQQSTAVGSRKSAIGSSKNRQPMAVAAIGNPQQQSAAAAIVSSPLLAAVSSCRLSVVKVKQNMCEM
jgi:hypothetical protein